MYKSILHFCENETVKLDKLSVSFLENPTDVASFVEGIKDTVINLGCAFMSEILEELDELIRESGLRKQTWEVVRRDQRTLITSLGTITFKKTLYKNKKNGAREYLLDKYMDMDSYARLSEDAEAKLLEEAVETSYRKAGEAVSIADSVSKGTVKNKIHDLKFPPIKENYGDKKQVKYLYIDADEDHVALQFFDKKGDIKPHENGQTYNSVYAKLVYVYEGIEKESPKSNRYKLVNPYYFGGIYEGNENKGLWDEVRDYIEENYDMDAIECIYLNADDGTWIKSCVNRIHNVVRVLDEYHLNKYLTYMTAHMYDSAEDARDRLRKAIRNGVKKDFDEVADLIVSYAEGEATIRRFEQSRKYILSNWTAAKNRLRKIEGVVGSSTEGHVSHILASRMSSRPMGWSKRGADRMARLRVYSWNNISVLKIQMQRNL